MLIINPGSHVEGGTEAQAVENARALLADAVRIGITGLVLNPTPTAYDDGRWTFEFTHEVTGVVREFDTHGKTDAECRALIFWPRSYWMGSSCSSPELEHFLAPGYEIVIAKANGSTQTEATKAGT